MVYSYPQNIDIYQHGILIEDDEIPASLSRIATTKLPIYSSFNLAIIDANGQSLNQTGAGLASVSEARFRSDYDEEYDLRYCVLSTLYHLNRLIDLYVLNCQQFEKRHPKGTAIRGNLHIPNAYYEVDAFLTSARRIYDSVSKVLWKHYYKNSKGRWRSIRSAVKSLDRVPPDFADILKTSWTTIGEPLTNYRDCVVHYVPLTNGIETGWMDFYEDRWGMTVKLPTNPTSKSRSGFDFASGPDALTYCHDTTTKLMKLCTDLMALKEISEYLNNPPR
ncbi:MAG: hypothetical protein KF685_13480 [Acidobacteria bacterium]|nr:hypothetical protein [Acidobacteriota bacterium]